jgi:NitT/TauT family transport system substrate-binding protein
VHAVPGAEVAAAITSYFPDVPRQRLANALERYKALGIWGKDPILPPSGYERLRASLVSGGLVQTGASYDTAVDNALAERVINEDPPALARSSGRV